MKRVGYDADTGRYYFRDRDGAVWQGAEGAEFSEMTKVSDAPHAMPDDNQDEDLEAAPTRADGYQPLSTDTNTMAYKPYINTSAYTTLFPFFLLIAVMLLLIWRLVLSPGLANPAEMCPKNTTGYWVQPGDSCWEIARVHGCSFDEFKELNQKVQCDPLMPGTTVCLPDSPRPTPS